MSTTPFNPELFRVMSPEERATFRARYLQWLQERDGAVDYQGRTLAAREEYQRRSRQNPVRWRGAVDVKGFEENHAKVQPGAALDPLTTWLLATAKANRGERYGIERAYRVGTAGRSAEPCDRYVETEEYYHTEILMDVVRLFGIDAQVLPPGTPARLAIQSMVHLPKTLSLPVVLAAEITGCVAFRFLLEKGVELTAAQPDLQQRVRELLGQILVDEVGHVAYCRARMGAAGLAAARMLVDGIAGALMRDLPEFFALVDRDRFAREVRAFDVEALAAHCPHPPLWTAPLVGRAQAA